MPDLPDLPDLPDRALAETQELVEAEDVAPLVLLRGVAEGDVAVVLAWRGESRDESHARCDAAAPPQIARRAPSNRFADGKTSR